MKRIQFLLLSLFFICISVSAQEKKAIRVACIGNSITQGIGVKNEFQNSYPGVLQQLLGKDYDVRNFGVSGRTLLNRGDYPYMHERMYRDAQNFLPDIVTIKLGTNDSKPQNWRYGKEFKENLEEMVDAFQALPSKPKIYLCLPVPATKIQWGINDSVITHYIIPIIRKVAKEKKTHIIDLHTDLFPYSQDFPDHVHPNEEGAIKIAGVIYHILTGKKADTYNSQQAFPGKKTTWEGFDRYDFTYNGRDAIVVAPQKEASGRPWIWRPAFFGAFASVDKALLEKGFHVAYYDLTHLYGSPRAVRLGTDFYNVMCRYYHLSPKVTLEGFSRGGYFAFNWAAQNADKIACMYVDAPVCDIQSWPSRKDTTLWNGFLKEWNLKDNEVDSHFQGNAIYKLEKLKDAHIPIIAVCGDSDTDVPYEENMKKIRDAYQEMGGVVELILKKGCGHHPHSLENPEPIVDFIIRYQEGYTAMQHINYRGSLTNAFYRFIKEKQGCVAFLGGSITEMKGWRDMIKEDLQQRFPYTHFTFIDAGISSTGSTPHAFRFEKDVLSKGTPDLLFVEAAVNDDTNGFKPKEQVRGMEGIVRHALQANPNMDVVMLHFIYDPFIPLFQEKQQPDVIMNHERVANHYHITSINLAQEIAERMSAGEFTWKEFGGTHPVWNGHKYYTATINRLFDEETKSVEKLLSVKHAVPQYPLDESNYEKGELRSIKEAKNLKGFRLVTDWTPADAKVGTRGGFVHVPMLEANKAGSSFQFSFKGQAVGIFCVAGPQAATLQYSIDGESFKKLNTYTAWSKSLYLPWVYMFATELSDKQHTLTVRMEKGECQIRDFVVNK